MRKLRTTNSPLSCEHQGRKRQQNEGLTSNLHCEICVHHTVSRSKIPAIRRTTCCEHKSGVRVTHKCFFSESQQVKLKPCYTCEHISYLQGRPCHQQFPLPFEKVPGVLEQAANLPKIYNYKTIYLIIKRRLTINDLITPMCLICMLLSYTAPSGLSCCTSNEMF